MYVCSFTGAQSDLLAAGVLQHLLGAAPLGYVKWGSNSAASRYRSPLQLLTLIILSSVYPRLGKAAAGAVNVPFAVCSAFFFFFV